MSKLQINQRHHEEEAPEDRQRHVYIVFSRPQHCKDVDLNCKTLLNNAFCSKPDQNRKKHKKVTDVCVVENLKLWWVAIL